MEMLKGWRTGEVAKFATNCWQVGNAYTFYVVMNKQKYQALPADVKKVFDQVSTECIEKHAQGWNNIDFGGKEFFEKKGGTVLDLSSEEDRKWMDAVKPVIENYVKQRKEQGQSEEDTWARIAFIKKTKEKLTQEQKEKGIKSPYTSN